MENALIAEPTAETEEAYKAVISSLQEAIDAFKAVKAKYDLLAKEITKAEALGMDNVEDDAVTTDASKADEFVKMVQDLKVAEYEYVSTKYKYEVELGTWKAEGPTGELSDQHWSGEKRPYLEQSSDAWGWKSWTIKYNQDVTLPAGSYVFKVAGRKAAGNGVTLELTVTKDGEVLGSVDDFPEGDIGLGINKDGVTSFNPEDKAGFADVKDSKGNVTQANGGRAFEWRYVKFILEEEATVNVAVNAEATVEHMWVSFCDATVRSDVDNTKLIEYNVAVNDAKLALTSEEYANVFGAEKAAVQALIDAEVEKDSEMLQAAIDALNEAVSVFKAAKATYDTLAKYSEETIAQRDVNIGDDAFQVSRRTEDTLWNKYIDASDEIGDIAKDKSEKTTVAEIEVAVEAYEKAVSDYENAELNAPAEGDVFNIMITTGDDYAFKNNPLTFQEDNASGAYFPQGVGVNANRAQQITFTKVTGNLYKLSTVNAEGKEIFIGTNKTINSEGDDHKAIRLTDDSNKALSVKVVPTTTDGVYNLYNTEEDNTMLGCWDNPAEKEKGGIYTTGNVHADFTITLAQKPVVELTVKAGKYATAIFPFATELPSGVKANTETIEGNTIKLEPVAKVEANVPYILSNTTEQNIDINVTGFGTATADYYTVGDLTGVYTTDAVPAGSYVLQTQEGVQAFYRVAEDGTLNAVPYRAYLTVTGGDVKAFHFGTNGDATAIKGVETVEGAENAVIYNLAGQRVVNPTKGGIYIVNGQKVLVK